MLTRREVLKSFAIGAAAWAIPKTMAAASPLKATHFNHISYPSADYKKTRDFYVDLLGFQASDEDDKQLYVWAGDALISCKNTPNVKAPLMDHFGLTLEPWNSATVKSVLQERGLNVRQSSGDPHDPAGPSQSIFTNDPFRYTVQLGPKDLEGKPAPVASKSPLKAVGINHISYQCADYKKVRDFYTDLFGVPVSKDDGKQAYLWLGDAYIVVRNNADGNPKPVVDHFGWTVANW